MVSNAAGGRNCKWEFRNFTKAGASSILPQPAFFHVATQACGCWRRRPLATARLEASSSEPRRAPDDYNSGPVGQGNDLRALHRAHTGLKHKKGRVLNEVGLFLGQGRDDVARGDFLCMVKGVQVYGESLDDTHAMKISDTSFVVPLRRSDAHIWSSANEPEFGKVANAKFIAHYAGHEVRGDLSAKDSIIAVALYAAEVIRAGDEIFAHYGSDYEGLRTYQPGEAAVLLKRDIPFEQYPSEIFGVSLPGDAIFRD